MNYFFSHFQLILLNNTSKTKKEVLFFNRAAKVGSVSIIRLLEAFLSKKNSFNIQIDAEDRANDGKLTKKEQVPYLLFYVNQIN